MTVNLSIEAEVADSIGSQNKSATSSRHSLYASSRSLLGLAGVFTVGAVNSVETIASFSSYGPTADGRVKPDVLGQGQNVYIVNYISGNNALSNGTSFSSPVMTGVIACFWQAFPNKTNMEIMDIVRKSA